MPAPITPATTAATTAATTTAAASASSVSAPGNEMNKDAFLKLMVAQLKYQDPLKPADSQSFMAQTAQFTQVEKLEELSAAITKSTRIGALSTASALLGRTITFALPEGGTASGVVSSASPATDGVSLKVGSRETTLDQIVELKG